jgi:hypothetical protein
MGFYKEVGTGLYGYSYRFLSPGISQQLNWLAQSTATAESLSIWQLSEKAPKLAIA